MRVARHRLMRGICMGLVLLLGGCVGGGSLLGSGNALGDEDDDGNSSSPWPPADSAPPMDGTGGPNPEPGDEGEGETGLVPMPPDLGACAHDDDCVFDGVDDTCFETAGTCEFGQCHFEPSAGGTPCDDGDGCTQDDRCNGMGVCLGGAPLSCEVEHGTAACTDGACDGEVTCEEGWGDCDGDASNGCENDLSSLEHCGGCGSPCNNDGPHVANAACVQQACMRSCENPWENCDGDWDNGCEIPTGVPNQCDADGLNAQDGCWTAHCGTSANPDARNFDTWFCFECTTCTLADDTTCRWCSHSTGNWFPEEACACEPDDNDCECVVDAVDYLDLTCSP